MTTKLCIVVSILIYSCESWTLTERLKNEKHEIELKMLRKVEGVTETYKI